MNKLRWGIIATGYISGRFASGLSQSNSGILDAVSSRTLESAQRFATEHGADRSYDSVEALLADPELDAVYIGTPHPQHAALCLQAIGAGKHVLCEKPIAMNLAEAESIAKAAQTANVVVMEAFMYRCHPQYAKLMSLLEEGAIGTPRFVQASFGFHTTFDPQGRLFAKSLGGGGILDVGCYPLSFACLVAGTSGELTDAHGTVHPESETDTFATAQLAFDNGLVAQISCATQLSMQNTAKIFGDAGWIEIPEPWIVARDGGPWSFTLHRDGESEPTEISGSDPRPIYGIEADHFHAIVNGLPTAAPGTSMHDSLLFAQLLEDWRLRLGVRYDCD